MTGKLFTDWLNQLNRQMRRQRRKILLFIDNAPSHIIENLSNVIVKFLPANTTSVLQPLDQGIIKAFKARYRKHQMCTLVSQMNECETVGELCKAISVLDAVNWINVAWRETTVLTIQKCFHRCGFPADNHDDDSDEEDDIPLARLAAILLPEQDLTAPDFLKMDNIVLSLCCTI